MLPTIISSDWGTKQTVNWINRSIPGKIEIQKLSLHWGKGQIIEGFVLKDPEEQTVLQIDRFSTEGSLWQILRKNPALGFTQIQELNAVIVAEDKGGTNLQRALGLLTSQTPRSESSSTIFLSNVNLESHLFVPNHPLSVRIVGTTRQDQLHGSFDIDVSLNELWALDWKKLKEADKYLSTEASKESKFHARILNFPVDLLDRIFAFKKPSSKGIFSSFLGDRLNLNLDKAPSQEGLAFHLTMLAPLLQGDVKGLIKRDLLTLKEPATFYLDLQPETINPFIHDQFTLMHPSRLEGILSNLSIPLNFLHLEIPFDPYLCGFKIDFRLAETQLDFNSIGPLSMMNLQANLNALPSDKEIQIEVIGQAQQDKEPFEFHFTSSAKKPVSFSEGVQKMREGLHSTLTISHLPLQLIPFFHNHLEWKEQFGPHANVQLEVHSKNEEEWLGKLSIQTPQLILKEAQFNIGKNITLLSPAELNWIISPDTLTTLFHAPQLVLDHSYPLNLILKKFQLPLENPQLTKVQIESNIPLLRFSKFMKLGIAQVDDFSFSVEGQSLSQLHTISSGRFSIFNLEGNPSPLIPEPLVIKQTSELKIAKEGIEVPSAKIQIDNSITHIHAEAQLSSEGLFEFTQAPQFEYTLSPLAFQTLNQLIPLHLDFPVALQEPMTINLSVEPTQFHLKSFSLADLYLQGSMGVKKIVVQLSSEEAPILEDIKISWVFDSPRNNIYSKIKAITYNRKEGKPGQISTEMQFWFPSGFAAATHIQSEVHMNLTGVPTSFANMIAGTPDLNLIFGSIIDLNLKTFYDPTAAKPGYFDIAMDSANFHMEGTFKLDQKATLLDPKDFPVFRLTVTPESYPHIKKILKFQDDRQLAHSFVLQGNLVEFQIPLMKSWTDQAAFYFKFSTNAIQWKNDAALPWKIEGSLSTKNFMKQVDFFVQASAKTSLNIQGTLVNLFDQKSRLRNWQEIGLQAKLSGQQLTPDFMENLWVIGFDQKQKLQALFGETFDINLIFQLEKLHGSIQALAKGTQGSIQLDGQIKEGVLTLNKPLEGSVIMTPLFTQIFLARNVPLLNSAIGAENPLTFTIDPSQFSCPLIPFQLERVKIGKATLSLGKILFRNEGELSSVLSLIRPLSDQLTIWFTPIYMEMERGILSLKRFDMLIGNAYTLANWGSINLLKHQANFVLGLSAQTLEYAFGIQGLDENDILQIPLHISKGKVELDKKKALARISALVGQRQLGSKGKLFGSILDMVFSDKDNHEEPFPSPTTHPFPWQGEFTPQPPKSKSEKTPTQSASTSSSSQEAEKPPEKKKKKKEKLLDQDSLKDLQDGAVKFLDQWLGH